VAQVVSLAREVVQQRTELADMGERIRDHLLIDDSDRFGVLRYRQEFGTVLWLRCVMAVA
jgi:hypothetical protein